MRTLPLFLLAASPALACGPGSGPPLENLLFLCLYLLLNPLTWVVLVVFVILAVLVTDASKGQLGSHSTHRPR